MFIDIRTPQTLVKPRRGVTPLAWLYPALPGLRMINRVDMCDKQRAPPELAASAPAQRSAHWLRASGHQHVILTSSRSLVQAVVRRPLHGRLLRSHPDCPQPHLH